MLGGTGLIGHNLIKIAKLQKIETHEINRQAKLVSQNHIDINLDLVRNALAIFKPDCLVDAIGLKSSFYRKVNIEKSNLNKVLHYYGELLSIVENYNTNFYFISSGGAIYEKNTQFKVNEESKPQPTTPYGIVNLKIENMVMQNESHVVIRGANIFGDFKRNKERQGLVTESFFAALENRTLYIDSLQTTRDYIYIDDFINILLGIIKTECRNEIINVGSGRGVETKEILNIIGALVIESGYKLKTQLKFEKNEASKIILDISKIKNFLPNYQFMNLKTALTKNWRDILRRKL